MGRVRTIPGCALLLILVMGCSDPTTLYEQSFELPDTGWSRDLILEGSLETEQDSEPTKAILHITFSPEFGYQNLYLSGDIRSGDDLLWSDTFSIQLTSTQAGEWRGRQVGDALIVTDTVTGTISWHRNDPIRFSFSQFSREELLRGIRSVQVEFVKARR